MKKINKNIVLFLLVYGFVFWGAASFVFSSDFLELITNNVDLLQDSKITVSKFTKNVEKSLTDNISIHDDMMDLNSLAMRCTGTDVVIKEDGTTIVRTDHDLLAAKHEYVGDEELNQYAQQVKELYSAAKEAGADFLYIEAPAKGYDEEYPGGVANYERSNYDRFAQALTEKNIPLLNLRAEMEKDGLSDATAFYTTDHHWKVETGFWAFGKICGRMNSDYGFAYDGTITDINSYRVKYYENWFLGAQGKKVGRWFTKGGADDIALITPKFDTDLTEEQPFKDSTRSGEFKETVLYLNHINTKDYYGRNPYNAYSGGDFRLQIVRNNRNPDGKKILLIRDSFGCAVAPFLSLTSSELHITDVRNFQYFVGDKLNMFDYIKKIKPDYVIVLYTSIGNESGGRFDFG